ncbi:transposase [Halomonas alkalisoli]|uniref:transposase n=1 Tax=Halomonas alkalisoli TaxID=2907158 RepID=UPI001F385EA1|nr:transposase [Halomonas alkalisoli]MCE9681688.1 transposase [Halomonas alkalisoli]
MHDVHRRRAREAPLLMNSTVRCDACAALSGPIRERIDWLLGGSPVITTLSQWVEHLVSMLPIRHVADLVGPHCHAVKTIIKQRLQRYLPAPDPTRLLRLMMDGFALHKGHRYATAVASFDTQQVVCIGECRSLEAIRPFIEWLGDARERIEAVAMDMNSASYLDVKVSAPTPMW